MSKETRDSKEIVCSANENLNEHKPYIRDAANKFHELEGTLTKRKDILQEFKDEFSLSSWSANNLLSELIGDVVDPIVQIPDGKEKWVGIVEFKEFNGAYGYIDYDDIRGEQKRVVCQKCVNDATYDTDVTHATAGDPNGSFDKDASYEELLQGIHNHYENTHDVIPSEIETGATLASGTTIGGNIAFHAGNDGDGSGLDADTVDGLTPSDLGLDPIYGNGEDGAVTESSGTLNNVYNATTFTLNGNVDVNGIAIINAQESIDINATIDATGASPTGGNGGTDNDEFGQSGGNGIISPAGTSGGSGGGSGGDGGDGDLSNVKNIDLGKGSIFSFLNEVRDNFEIAAGGGGGGSNFEDAGSDANGTNGSFPGGGGDGATDANFDSSGDGGDGGNGGGLIILNSPEIDITGGQLVADGEDGGDGSLNGDNTHSSGGGGGGAGGVIIIRGKQLSGTSNTSVSGGSGGTAPSTDWTGGDGASHVSGEVAIIEQI